MESVLSIVCEAFDCTPSEALKEDMVLVRKILEARTLEAAKAQHNADVNKMTEDQTKLWLEMLDTLND